MTIATHPSALGRAAGAATPADHVIVLFGATGDLAKRKLLPAQTILLQESSKSREPKGEQGLDWVSQRVARCRLSA